MKKELPKGFEQILNITEPWYIAKIKQLGDTSYICRFQIFFIELSKFNLILVYLLAIKKDNRIYENTPQKNFVDKTKHRKNNTKIWKK